MLKKMIIPLLLLLILAGCGGPKQYKTQIFAMNTVMDLTVTAPEEEVLQQATELIFALERQLSATDPDSEISRLNHSGSAVLSRLPGRLLEQALGFCEKTGGALDISIYPAVRAWGFTTDAHRIPDQEELDRILQNVDYRRIAFDPASGAAALPEGMQIDLGSVAKGFAADAVTALLRENGVRSGLLNLGGNIQAIGSKPDGSPWRIAVRDPNREGYLGVLTAEDCAVVTSGGYERFFTGPDGTVYWHIIDPATGAPARSGLLSATAVGKEGAYCDALSTALFIMGPEKAADFWRANRDFEMLLVKEDGTVLITPELAEHFTMTEGLDYTLQRLDR